MSTTFLIAVVFGMFAVTFAIRFVLLARAHRTYLPAWLEEALRFVPVAVLTAIIMPMLLMPNKQWDLDWHNPWLLGGGAAFVTGLVLRKPLITIVFGVVVFFVSKALIS
ncbi:AzlD domain-containing protein [Thiolinea disciformis]|uniref:AzlD domain-containing protein n=1 Tax=Thiolinea disciformis TaxID=125614 RepID=UPI0003785F19|nr:AzlD domain-containing protein [Thiolinea disciformis]